MTDREFQIALVLLQKADNTTQLAKMISDIMQDADLATVFGHYCDLGK